MRYHTGEKPFKCPHCDYWCREDTNLKLHIALHFSRRDFVCDSCGAAFHQKKTLDRHVLYKHSDTRNFSCSHCSMSFKTRYALGRHEQVHNSSRPFKCGTCAAAFKRLYNLRHHMRTVHSGLGATTEDGELLPPPRHVKVIDAPEGEVIKGNRKKKDRASVTELPPPPLITGPYTTVADKQQEIQAQDAWQKVPDNNPLQMLLATPIEHTITPQEGQYTTPLLPQPTSTLNHDIITRLVLPPTSVPGQNLGQNINQQMEQPQQQHYLTMTDVTQQQPQPVLVDKQYQDPTYPYYLLPSVNPQQT